MCEITGILRVRKGDKDDRLFYSVDGLNVIPAEGSNPPSTGGYYRMPVSVVRKQKNGHWETYIFAAAFLPVAA